VGFLIAMIPPLLVFIGWQWMKKEHGALFDRINHQLKRDEGKDIFEYCEDQSNGIFNPLIIGVAAAAGGIYSVSDFYVGWAIMIIIGLSWAFCRRYLRVLMYLRPIITSHEAHEKERQQQRRNDEHVRQNTFDVDDDEAHEGDFGFDESRFGGGSRQQSAKDENAPRGYDRRHPDDANLWAFVDDPDSNPNEARAAHEKILRRQAARRGGNGGDGRGVVKRG